MSLTTFIGITAAVLALLCIFFLLLLRWKNAILTGRFNEALHVENNGDPERAIHLYQQALQGGQGIASGDKKLLTTIERRLKTLQTNTEFVRRFRRAEMEN